MKLGGINCTIVTGILTIRKRMGILQYNMLYREKYGIDGIQYSGATVAFLGPTHRFLCFYGVLPGDSDVLMF